jgi:hypothetical protein
MTAQSARILAPLFLAAVLAGGCGGVIDPSQNQVDEKTGTIAPGGLVFQPFSVSKNGEFEIRITNLNNADALLHMAYGPDTGGCTGASLGEKYLQLNQAGFGGLIQKGNYCVYLRDDLLALKAESPYTLRISHP